MPASVYQADANSAITGAFNPSTNALKVEGISPYSGGIWTLPYDYVSASYPDAVTETYVSKSGGAGGSVQQTVTVVYTDSTKVYISSITRS